MRVGWSTAAAAEPPARAATTMATAMTTTPSITAAPPLPPPPLVRPLPFVVRRVVLTHAGLSSAQALVVVAAMAHCPCAVELDLRGNDQLGGGTPAEEEEGRGRGRRRVGGERSAAADGDKWHRLDNMSLADVNKETGLTYTDRGLDDDGWFYMQTGGWIFRKAPTEAVSISGDLSKVPDYLKPKALGFR